MNIAKEFPDKNSVQLTVTVDADKLVGAKKTAAKNLANRLNIPGFRKGKAPLGVVESHVGKQALMDEAAEILIQEAATQTLKDENLTPVDDIDYEVVTNDEGSDFVFKMKFTPYPEVKLGTYKGLKIDKVVEEVTDDDVARQLEIMRDHHAVLTDAAPDDAIADGDFITLDFDGYIDGKKFEGGEGRSTPLTIGSGKFIPGFEDQLVGAKVGQELDVNVTFPEDYHDKSVEGKAATFKCKILSLKHKQLPELDDAFAAKASAFKTLEELRENIRRNMIEAAERSALEKQTEKLLDEVSEGITVDIPPVMIENQITQMIREQELQLRSAGMTLEDYFQRSGHEMSEYRESMRETAEQSVRASLMLEAVASAENIKVEDADYRYEVAVLAATYGLPPKEIQKIIKKERQGALLVSSALRRKVVNFLVQNNNILPTPEESKSDENKAADDKAAPTPASTEEKPAGEKSAADSAAEANVEASKPEEAKPEETAKPEAADKAAE